MRVPIGLLALVAAQLLRPAPTAPEAAANTMLRPAPQAVDIDLTGPFKARSSWRFAVTEGPPAEDYGGNAAPGALTFCLHRGSGPCISRPVTFPIGAPSPQHPLAWEPHYLIAAKVVYPNGRKAAPLLLIVTGSLNSGDGDQLVATQLLGYDGTTDTFRRVFGQRTGRNNNQEIRFITEGPLRGSVISAEPQQHLPYRYWIVVDKPNAAGTYEPVLRYASATLYNDGNSLAVIDSEMPNVERHLGLWRPGRPIPTPDVSGGKPCSKPTLRKSELWCGSPITQMSH